MLRDRERGQHRLAGLQHLGGPAVGHPGVGAAGLQGELHGSVADPRTRQARLAQLDAARA
ncbi:MAG TPA: hypothetical protein VIY52_23680 [Streptosporangiaceae bacterium]